MNEQLPIIDPAVPKPAINTQKGSSSVIGRWTGVGIAIALLGNLTFSAVLITQLDRSEESVRQHDETEKALAQKRKDLATLGSKLDAAAIEQSVITPKIEGLRTTLQQKTDAEVNLVALRSHIRTAEEGKTQLDKQNEIKASRETALKKSIELLEGRLASLNDQFGDIDDLEKRALDAEARLNEATTRTSAADVRRSQLDMEIKTAQSDFDELKATYDDLGKKTIALREEKVRLDGEITSLRDALKSLDEMQAKLSKLTKDIADKEILLASLGPKSAVAEAKLALAITSEQDLSTKIGDLKSQAKAAEAEAIRWEETRKKNETDAKKAADDAASALEELTRTKATDTQLKKDALQLSQDNAAAKQLLGKLQKDTKDEATRLGTAKGELDNVKDELLKLDAQKKQAEELIAHIAVLEREKARLTAERDGLLREKQELQKSIGELEARAKPKDTSKAEPPPTAPAPAPEKPAAASPPKPTDDSQP